MCKSTSPNKSDGAKVTRSIERFSRNHAELSYAFKCNVESCDNPQYYQEYLQFHALTDMRMGMSITYVMLESVDDKPSAILGFVSLKANSLLSEDENGKQTEKPAIEISQFAVADGYERQGVGSDLFKYALALIHQTRSTLGVQYLLVYSDPQAVGFYKKMHCREISSFYEIPNEGWNANCTPMMMKLPEVDVL